MADKTVTKMFKYRIYPNKAQKEAIDTTLELCRKTYNDLLEIKIETYQHGHESLGKYDLNGCLLYLKENNPDIGLVHSQVLQNISDRVHKSFRNMFCRIKRGEKPGFPRFRGKNRYKSLCYPQSGFGFTTNDKKLQVSKIGEIKIKKHREMLDKVKTMTIKRTPTNKYYAVFSCEVEIPKMTPNEAMVGIDVGLTSFLTTDKGLHIKSPKHYRKAEERLGLIQRQHSNKKKGSKNREKSRLKVALLHEKVSNQRSDFTHKLSHQFTTTYGFIAVENLNITGMVRNHHLAKSIQDSGWGMFINQLCYKAEWAGGIVKQVGAFYPSSQLCSKCNARQKMPLDQRIFKCHKCGHTEDRDTNAAKNILQEVTPHNTVGTTGINACGNAGLPASMNQEATLLVGW